MVEILWKSEAMTAAGAIDLLRSGVRLEAW